MTEALENSPTMYAAKLPASSQPAEPSMVSYAS